jgi:hypothetical protein
VLGRNTRNNNYGQERSLLSERSDSTLYRVNSIVKQKML